ncbi:TPA: hypothetical protein I8Z55_001346 [Legionella pneumophila]|nr:hypothetical protein [Legionella pneumophila]HAT8316064.1 hypothetical protein [Legionella pneumophila]
MNKDFIRENILNYLYDISSNARSPTSAAIGIRDMQQGLREKFGYKQQEVSSNLNYLIDKKWVLVETETNEFKTKEGTTRKNEVKKYRITSKGMDHIEGPSKFAGQSNYAGINISNISGTVILGNSNILVYEKYEDLYNNIDILHRNILDDSELDDSLKLEIASDLASIKNQLSKGTPDSGIIKKLWGVVEKSVTLNRFAEILSKISEQIYTYFN